MSPHQRSLFARPQGFDPLPSPLHHRPRCRAQRARCFLGLWPDTSSHPPSARLPIHRPLPCGFAREDQSLQGRSACMPKHTAPSHHRNRTPRGRLIRPDILRHRNDGGCGLTATPKSVGCSAHTRGCGRWNRLPREVAPTSQATEIAWASGFRDPRAADTPSPPKAARLTSTARKRPRTRQWIRQMLLCPPRPPKRADRVDNLRPKPSAVPVVASKPAASVPNIHVSFSRQRSLPKNQSFW